jgi:hypothetical protein
MVFSGETFAGGVRRGSFRGHRQRRAVERAQDRAGAVDQFLDQFRFGRAEGDPRRQAAAGPDQCRAVGVDQGVLLGLGEVLEGPAVAGAIRLCRRGVRRRCGRGFGRGRGGRDRDVAEPVSVIADASVGMAPQKSPKYQRFCNV